MKFTLASILSITSVALLSLSSVQSVALPNVAEARTLEKREIKGLNNYACKLTKAHPRPVILVHATLLTLDSWKDFVPTLVAAGYCPFALTYGKYGAFQQFGGMAPIEQSAQELATFAEDIMSRHSQGGILGRYWIKYLGGEGKVNKMIGVSPINHGTTLSNIVTVAKAFGVFTSGQATFDKIAPSFYQMVNTSPFIAKLNKGGDVAPGVITSNIATKYDQIVSPYASCFQSKAGVTNKLLQDLCMVSLNEHLTMVNSKVVLRWVMNQLDPSTAETASCLSMF
ncbi:hypothetical protein BGZ93_008636 [Podila epicladia]|nr:hypothetical protein BGZ92_001475 [Podila epicladia]KAG0091892.1 hypothetical protein BGZ93_008636 [Podila epicladia]